MSPVMPKGKLPGFSFSWGLRLFARSREKSVVGGAGCKNPHGSGKAGRNFMGLEEQEWCPGGFLYSSCSFVNSVYKGQSVYAFFCP